MSRSSDRVALEGSNRAPLSGAAAIGYANPDERIEVTVVLQPSAQLTKEVDEMNKIPFKERKYLTDEEFEKKYGPSQGELEKVCKFAHENGLEVKDLNKAARTIKLAGTVSSMDKAFGVKLQRYKYTNGSYRGREGEIFIPESLKDIILAVEGLDDRPVAKPHFRSPHKQFRADAE
jgi:kumamolisin